MGGIPGVGPEEIDAAQALWFLDLLGKSERTARLRAFPHKDNPRKEQIGARKGAFDLYAAQRWQDEGRSIYLVINDGGDDAKAINTCRALFVEWDDKPMEWQLLAWQELHLPEPSLMVATGGKSLHCYWLLDQPINPQQWQPLQTRLITHCASDKNCKDLSRVMRLPGSFYIDATGKRTRRVEIIKASAHRYQITQIEACLPAQKQLEQRTKQLRRYPQAPRHTLKELAEALAHIPPRPTYDPKVRTNTYETYRNVLWGLVAACKDLGFDEHTAVALMEAHSPSRQCGWNVPQVARTAGEQVTAGSFFFHAKQHGWRPTAND